MGKQIDIFGKVSKDKDMPQVSSPTYTPKGKKPHILELTDITKSVKLSRKIMEADVTEDERAFLILASHRHTKFHYQNIAEYYCHASPEMQRLMEESALVIVDYQQAIEQGFMKFTEAMGNIYEKD